MARIARMARIAMMARIARMAILVYTYNSFYTTSHTNSKRKVALLFYHIR